MSPGTFPDDAVIVVDGRLGLQVKDGARADGVDTELDTAADVYLRLTFAMDDDAVIAETSADGVRYTERLRLPGVPGYAAAASPELGAGRFGAATAR